MSRGVREFTEIISDEPAHFALNLDSAGRAIWTATYCGRSARFTYERFVDERRGLAWFARIRREVAQEMTVTA